MELHTGERKLLLRVAIKLTLETGKGQALLRADKRTKFLYTFYANSPFLSSTASDPATANLQPKFVYHRYKRQQLFF